jgi:hypothetical protein
MLDMANYLINYATTTEKDVCDAMKDIKCISIKVSKQQRKREVARIEVLYGVMELRSLERLKICPTKNWHANKIFSSEGYFWALRYA